MRIIKEADWKLLRELRAPVLDRYCEKLLREANSPRKTAERHSQDMFMRALGILQNGNDDIMNGFGDLRRSNALERLAFMKTKGIITTAEIARFSKETQETVSRFEQK